MNDTNTVPLVVDLDGTLLRTDVMWESLARLLRRNPLAIFQILFWWTRGRAFLKQRLARRVQLDPAALPYNKKFLVWLREQKKSGRQLILATASDLKMAQPVAEFVGLFDAVLASDGKTNLRSRNKLRVLTEKFGERGFDYAGNSAADFAVWRGARQAVVVNASRRVRREAANCAKLGPMFCDDFSAVAVAKSFCVELFWRSGYLVAIVAGLLLASAFPGLDFAGGAWVAPALMLAAARGKSRADAFRVGYVAGLTFWLASLYWLLFMPAVGFPILGWLALAAYLAVFPGVWVWLVSHFKFENSSWSRRLIWSLGGAAAWVALEMVRARLFTGFPWNLLGDSQFKLVPLIQIASVAGVYGVSFLVAWFSLALFSAGEMIFRNPTRRHVWQAEIILPMLAVVFCFVGGFFAMNRPAPPENFLRVTLVQPSFPQTLIWSPSEDQHRFQQLLQMSQAALVATNRTELLVWPESAVPDIDDATGRAISQFAQTNQVWILLNGDDAQFQPTTNYFNSAFLVNPAGQLVDIYHKRQLVIFGEYVPLANWLPFLKYLTPIEGGWTPGTRPAQFQIFQPADTNVIAIGNASAPAKPFVQFSPLICFEDVFPGLARDAAADNTDFLVDLTNDGWFGRSAAQWQHAAAAVFRTVENGLPLVCCANNGVTCWIDACGRIQRVLADKTGDVHGPGAMTVDIPVGENRSPTFYHRHGDWFGWSCVGATLLTLLLKLRRTRNLIPIL